ncbi:calcineurin-like phosphoesterase family protein [Novilysobacter erysipheiresistens]|uniref:Calcineurin-like phosphoesterase family protein n=1 Tax=Novilysobacter erysipheiresistens TaxID=1749332 RepID=A0ABU7YW85_9GAMM
MPRSLLLFAVLLLDVPGGPAHASAPCNSGTVFEDLDADGVRDQGEPGIAGARLSDGVQLVVTDADGRYALPVVDGRSSFLIKPAGYEAARRDNGLPDYWRNVRTVPGPALKYGGIPVEPVACRDFALGRIDVNVLRNPGELRVALFADPQVKSVADVGYYARDIIDSLRERYISEGAPAEFGITLGDVVDDDLSLYPALNAVTATAVTPWLHAPGNHDLDLDAGGDAESLLTFRNTYGPDTFAWEEQEANVIVLDDVVYRPGRKPAYIGGLREDQFAFLEAYLPTAPKDRLLVVAVHIPLFEASGRDSFRDADRERLFALLDDFPHVLLLSGHSHTQRHVFHGADNGWHGAQPLHEYNVGAASGAFWSGVEGEDGIPDATMADGTPNGYALLTVRGGGDYDLAWHPAGLADDDAIRPVAARPANDPAMTRAMALHAPRVLRHGAYPAAAVYANVFMGMVDTRVEYRIDDGPWQAMERSLRPDPRLLAENARDDAATALRGYDRAPEAQPSTHLWRGALPTDLAIGEHRVEVRAFDRWQGEQRASTRYRLAEANE